MSVDSIGIGGCALNPRLLFPNKPRDSNQIH
jgi:hypothetical protein